jgi:hypothetical protein
MHTLKRKIFTDPTAVPLTQLPDARSRPISSPNATAAIMRASTKTP